MLQLTLTHWNLQVLAKEHPDVYLELRKHKVDLPEPESMAKGDGWHGFEAPINDMSDLPDVILSLASYKALRPMKWLRTDGSVEPQSIKNALALQQVHLPGNELLRVNTVIVEEDFCTNALQERLKQGWRIIAVCPQPSRRPDYILGRCELTP